MPDLLPSRKASEREFEVAAQRPRDALRRWGSGAGSGGQEVPGGADEQREFGALHPGGDGVAADRGGEAALRAQREPFSIDHRASKLIEDLCTRAAGQLRSERTGWSKTATCCSAPKAARCCIRTMPDCAHPFRMSGDLGCSRRAPRLRDCRLRASIMETILNRPEGPSGRHR